MNHTYNSFIDKNLPQLLQIYQKESSTIPAVLLIQIDKDNKIQVYTQPRDKLSDEHQDEIKRIQNRSPELLKLNRHVLTCATQKVPFPVQELFILFTDPKEDYLLRGYQQSLVQDSYTFEFETFRVKMDKEDYEAEDIELETGGVPEKSNFKGEWNIQKTSTGQKFLRICRLAIEDDDVFEGFRSEMDYQNIIIGGDDERAQAYLDLHPEISTTQTLQNQLQKCDQVGNPPITDAGYSTYTLRAYHTYRDLLKYFDTLHNKKIIEIGGGHGGLCHLITEMTDTEMYQSYTLVDLPQVNQLAEKYLSRFPEIQHTKIKYMSSEQIIPRKYDILVSEYAFSELDPRAQKYYLENVVKYCQTAYLAMNVWDLKMKEYLKTYLGKYFVRVEEYSEEPISKYPNYIWVCYKK